MQTGQKMVQGSESQYIAEDRAKDRIGERAKVSERSDQTAVVCSQEDARSTHCKAQTNEVQNRNPSSPEDRGGDPRTRGV